MRIERDSVGEIEIAADALYGIHAVRARDNFPDATAFHHIWYTALGAVKLACYQTYKKFMKSAKQKYSDAHEHITFMEEWQIDALIRAADEVSGGQHFDDFIVPAISGGAGTSINMNINEIITNRALSIAGKKPGDYTSLDPIEHANIYQSTNDVIPTSLKLAVMEQLDILETAVNLMREEVEKIETEHQYTLRSGYTQMQEAVPTSFGKLFSTYSDALSRDWWRISKAFERIKMVNLGGSAIGTGLTVPRYFIFEVVDVLRELVKKPVTRAENLSDQTSNLDSFVEVHAILKAHAVNLEKIASDIRLLASDLHGNRAVSIPARQTGSSIMPGKVNPVISEFIVSAAHKVYANDTLITSLAGQGCLELNAYLPLIGHSLLESLQLLTAADYALLKKMLTGLTINSERSYHHLVNSASITTVLLPVIGYNRAAECAVYMKEHMVDIFTANKHLELLPAKQLEEVLKPHNLLKLGFTIAELKESGNATKEK